jgi:hypothetical protein
MYIQGARQRVEFPGVVTIDQCDLNRSVLLNTTAKRYQVQPHATPAVAAPAPAAAAPEAADPFGSMSPAGMTGKPSGQQARGGVITLTTTLSDTLERQEMFGLEARHVKTTILKQASDKACDKTPMRMEIDAWYVDLPTPSMCVVPNAPPQPAAAADPDACTDRLETRTVGAVTLGFPVKSVTTTTTGEGDKAEALTVSQEVTALEITRLDAALFDVPSDYVEAKSSAEILPALATGGSLADALFGSTADGTSEAVPKQAGVIRVGILEPVNRTDRQLSTSALRRELANQFNKAPYEAIPLAGSSPAAIEQDAARLECDYVLVTEITGVKSSKPGKVGGMMRRATGDAARDHHEVELSYSLFAVAATGTPAHSGTTKASSGGFSMGSALRLAAFAGQMYMGMYGMGGMGGMGLMNVATMTASGGGPMGGFFDPRASAMNSAAMGMDGGLQSGDPSEQEMRQTVSEALGNAAKAITKELSKKK